MYSPCTALCLAVGVIFYISAVNDEVSHRKKSITSGTSGVGFEYSYGWAFFFAGSSFVSAMNAAVSNISMYLRRFPNAAEDSSRTTPCNQGLVGIQGVGGGGGQLVQAMTSDVKQPELVLMARPISRINITTPV